MEKLKFIEIKNDLFEEFSINGIQDFFEYEKGVSEVGFHFYDNTALGCIAGFFWFPSKKVMIEAFCNGIFLFDALKQDVESEKEEIEEIRNHFQDLYESDASFTELFKYANSIPSYMKIDWMGNFEDLLVNQAVMSFELSDFVDENEDLSDQERRENLEELVNQGIQ